jgi:NifU-like protein involved in Fe-S cluster formation
MEYRPDAFFPFTPTVIALTPDETRILNDDTQMFGTAGATSLTDNLFSFVAGRTTAGVPQTRAAVRQMFTEMGSTLFEQIHVFALRRQTAS